MNDKLRSGSKDFLPDRSRYYALTILSLILLSSTFILSSKLKAQGQKDSVVVLEHADSLVGMEVDGEKARQLIGHVRLRHVNTIVTCERAIQYLTSNKFSMDGVVEVHDDTMRLVGMRGMYYPRERIAEAFDRVLLEDQHTVLKSQYAKYYANEKKAYFKGNVYVEDTASVVTADEVTYFREEGKSIAEGNVKILNANNSITIYGNHFENYKKINYSIVTDHPKVVQIDTTAKGEKDTLIVTAVLLESYRDTLERLIATDSVRITRSNLAAESGACTYFTNLDSIVLRKLPFVWYESGKYQDNQVSGESIFIKLKKRRLETVYVRGRAVAISRADTARIERFNQMTGQEIILHFADDKIQRVNVISTATSLYYLSDKANPNGMNVTTGDEIRISFTDGKIDKIKAISGVEGKYFPEKMIKGKESDYNLPEFNWREDRPGRKK